VTTEPPRHAEKTGAQTISGATAKSTEAEPRVLPFPTKRNTTQGWQFAGYLRHLCR
jgi:hypothetical protein